MLSCDLADDSAKNGDFYLEKKYEVGPDTADVEEDLNLVQQLAPTTTAKAHGMLIIYIPFNFRA